MNRIVNGILIFCAGALLAFSYLSLWYIDSPQYTEGEIEEIRRALIPDVTVTAEPEVEQLLCAKVDSTEVGVAIEGQDTIPVYGLYLSSGSLVLVLDEDPRPWIAQNTSYEFVVVRMGSVYFLEPEGIQAVKSCADNPNPIQKPKSSKSLPLITYGDQRFFVY